MEVCGEGETAVNQGSGDAPLGRRQVSWEEQVQAEEERKSKDDLRKKLPPLPLWNTSLTATATPPVAPSTSDDRFIMVQGWKSPDKRPRETSKDPTPQQRPSKASWSPVPFPLRNKSERVANVHTIFEVTSSQTRPLSEWVYDRIEAFSPHKMVEQLVYFSNVLCLSISEFHLSSACTPLGMCTPVLPLVVEAELPPLETYLHEGELGTQDVHIHCIAAIKLLRVWLHQVDMTMHYNKGRANSPCSDDHKLGTLLDFFLMPENTGVSLKHIIDWVVAENVDTLKVCLIKSKKLLKEASKIQTKLLTHLVKQKMTLEKTHLSKKARGETSKVLSQTTEQLDQARTTVSMHTADIVHIEALLEDYKSMDEESSSPGESSTPKPGSGDPPAANPQGQEEEDPHDIEMRDVQNDPNLPPPSEQDDDPLPVPATQIGLPPEDNGDREDLEDSKDVIIKDERIVIKTGGATPIMLAEDQLLYDQVGTGAETPSRAVIELLSQINMDSPAIPPVASDPTSEGQDT